MEAGSPRRAIDSPSEGMEDTSAPFTLPTSTAGVAGQNSVAFTHNGDLPPMNTSIPIAITQPTAVSQGRKISEAGLHVETDIVTGSVSTQSLDNNVQPVLEERPQHPESFIAQRAHLASRRSFETIMTADSPASSVSSPALGALRDITPLPSPIFPSELHGLWTKPTSRPHASSSASIAREEAVGFVPNIHFPPPSSKKKKSYKNIISSPLEFNLSNGHDNLEASAHNRSLSEYTPEHLHNVRPRNVTTPGLVVPPEAIIIAERRMQREEYLSRQRGLSTSIDDPSSSLQYSQHSKMNIMNREDCEEYQKGSLMKKDKDCMVIRTVKERRRTLWRSIRRLGEGSFSRVVLAVRDDPGLSEPLQEHRIDPAHLAAIKMVSYGPAAGADEARMETSIKREIDVLQSLQHPSLPHMIGFEDEEPRALLALNYCAGGDLFEAASQHKDLFSPVVIQRMFAELVGAVRYLHNHSIVHRDIKLENVLLNIPIDQISSVPNLLEYPYAILTLTDLGLSKRLPSPPASPLLHHQCGSIDYTAPEILLGQPYDGRITDAWALGVLLYALMEGRLPFDTMPGKRVSNVKHRIARCDWMWCAFGDEYGEWIRGQTKGVGLEGAREVVEGLLKKVSRGRWNLDTVAEHKWVQAGLAMPLKTIHADDDQL